MIKNIIVDFKQTIYNPESGSLLDNAVDGLKVFKEKGFFVRLVGRGEKAEISRILDRLGIAPFFNDISIDDDKEKFFTKVDDPSEWLVIGDRAHREILFGGQLGMNTIWLKNGKFSTEEPKIGQKLPDYVVSSWKEIIDIIKQKG